MVQRMYICMCIFFENFSPLKIYSWYSSHFSTPSANNKKFLLSSKVSVSHVHARYAFYKPLFLYMTILYVHMMHVYIAHRFLGWCNGPSLVEPCDIYDGNSAAYATGAVSCIFNGVPTVQHIGTMFCNTCASLRTVPSANYKATFYWS